MLATLSTQLGFTELKDTCVCRKVIINDNTHVLSWPRYRKQPEGRHVRVKKDEGNGKKACTFPSWKAATIKCDIICSYII